MTVKHLEEIASRYFDCVRERNLAGVLALFADNASCVMPDGRSFAGEAAVREWFSKLFDSHALSPRVLATVVGQAAVAVEVENVLPDGSQRNTANFFHFNSSGLIEHLRAYRRG